MGDAKIKIALVLIAILIFAVPVAIAQQVPAHVVISEVQIATNEFVELYNPTNSDINMTGWHWCYFSPGGNWNKSERDRTFTKGVIIPAHGFYLIATIVGDFPTADWNLDYKVHFLSDTAGSVGIFPWDPDTKTAEEAKAGKIDAVGWGSVTHVYETATASTPSSGESIEREPLKDGYAPCQDTDDNSADFDEPGTPTPKNKSSPKMEPAPVTIFDENDEFKGGFIKIQNAVDTASDGYTIRVDNGTYNENVDVYTQLTICSEYGATVTTISASDPNDNVITVTADSVAISGFDVTGATDNAGGIYLKDVKHCNIIDNSASNNNIGILLYQSNYNTITNNNVSDNENGISLSSSDDNAICNNYFDNTNNAIDDGNNVWNIAKIGGTNIIGGPYLGGNYWSDYAGADTDNDGLGDFLLPYNSCGDIEDGGDMHPLVPVGSAPKLSIEKSDELDALPPGGTLRYTIIVKNTGNATATKVNVTDTYDANVTFASAVPIPSQGNDTWIFPMLNVSETKWINISVTVNSATPIGTVLNNSVNVSCDEGDTDTDTEATTVSAGYAPPEITSFAPDSPVNDAVGAWRTFNVTMNQTVDVEWYLDNGYQHTNENVQAASFEFPAVEGEHNVTANASNVYGSDSHSWVWNVKQQEISVTKVGNVTEASPSTLVNFTITVSNIGDCALHTVVVKDTLPAGMTYNSSDPSANTTTGAIIWNNVGPLAAGASETITLVVQIGENAEGVLNNTVNVTGTPPTGDSVSATDTAQVRVKQPGISVTKGNVTGAPSTLVKFTITVSNTGDFTLNHVVVKDTLPTWMTYKTSDTPAYTPDGINITWNITGSLDVGASKTITLVARIGENATGELTNTVNVTGTTLPTGVKVYDDATAQVRVIRLKIKKSCKSSTTSLGKTVEYTITYSNPNMVNLTNVVITEHYPKVLTFTSAVPAPDPGTNNKWTIGTLPVDGSGKITIKMKVPASMTDFSYEESGSVSGEGIVMISKELSTKVEPFDLENIVTISGSYGAINVSATASAITTVSVSGSSLEITEHGSGTYESEEELSVSPEKMGIKFDKTTNAEYSPTTFKCSDGFVMEVPSKWSQDICIKNYVKKSAIHKTITEATYMNDNTIIKSDNKGYTMDFDSSFLGYMHVDKKTTDAATSEHYIGEFVITSWDQSGKEIVEGVGYVIVDKELSSGRLLLMEHGSGYYLSEEDSSSSSIKKITVAEYEPTSFYFSDGFVVNFSSKWMQDVCARSGTGTSALHKKIRDATFIDDDTIASSSPSLKFETFFYGATHVGSKSGYSKASEDYIGDFYISWGASSTFIFDWDDVPGPDDDDLIDHLSEPKFNMSWVTDDDVEITKSSKKDKITISTPEHSAEIILDTETDESAELIVDGVDTYTFNVVKHGKTLKVYDPEFKRKPEVVTGEGFVMVDEAIFRDGEIQVTEHGSGTYYSEEAFGSKTIEKETYGEYKPTYFEFSDSFAVNFSSLWLQDICVKDKKEGTAIHKRISDAALMKDDTIAAKSLMNITSSFNGSMHIGARTENVSISEDYIGQFNVTELIKIVKGEPPKASSESSDWLFCPCPIPSSPYLWFCQDPTYRRRWLSVCPYPYKDNWLYIHP